MERIPDALVVFVPCRWEHSRLSLKIVFDLQGQIIGLWTVAEEPQKKP